MKILFITSHFPSFDCPERSYATPFLFQYARELIKQGNEVLVIHFARAYPFLFNFLAIITGKFGSKKLIRFYNDPRSYSCKEYEHEGICIIREKYVKYIPHGSSFKTTIDCLLNSTKKHLYEHSFRPEIIIGDCLDPVVNIIEKLKKEIKCKSFQIIHDSDILGVNKKQVDILKSSFDALLLRSRKQKITLDSILGSYNYLYMFSGVTDDQIASNPVYRTKIQELLYVGALFESKGLGTVIDALDKSRNKNLKLTVVGDGIDRKSFEEIVKMKKLENRVVFVGKVPHNQVFSFMRQADALVLISRETFGMVYVEAMSQACIPIGAVNEGIDGIVVNKKNGFLSPLGNANALADLFDDFSNEPETIVREISFEAYSTSMKMVNSFLAESLIDKITNENYLLSI